MFDLIWKFSFQVIFQMAFIFELSELLPVSDRLLPSFSHFCATPKALSTVNFPFVVQAHMNESSCILLLIGMPNTTFASWWRKILLTLATSQIFLSTSMRSDTSSASAWGARGLIALKESGIGIHLSSQICTLYPLPAHNREPHTIIYFAANILRHAYEGRLPNWACKNGTFAKYFAL